MSISSHLTPEPERRLWLILDLMSQAVERAEWKAAGVAALAAAEVAVLKPGAAAGGFLAAALALGLYGFSPLSRLGRRLPMVDAPPAKQSFTDCMIAADDVIKYAHGELIHKLDKYLGGGITATQYYEDIVGQILVRARLAARKERLLTAACLAAALGQLGLFRRLIP